MAVVHTAGAADGSGAADRRRAGRLAPWAFLALLASGCTQALWPSPASTPQATLAILYSAPNEGCPLAAAVDVTFQIDAYAPEAVIAIADDGMVMHVRWPSGFVGGTYDEQAVKDPNGVVVVRDGQRLVAPPRGFPKLPGGWPVCFGGRTVWVQEHPLP
jgi:hypothetical protein